MSPAENEVAGGGLSTKEAGGGVHFEERDGDNSRRKTRPPYPYLRGIVETEIPRERRFQKKLRSWSG